MAQNDPSREPWHLDKRIPVAVIFTLLFQFGVGSWWLSDLSARVARHDSDIARLQAADDKILDIENKTSERLTRLEGRLDTQIELLRRIELKLAPHTRQ